VGQGSITHIIRTGLAERMKSFCEPVIAIQWNEPELIAELREKNFEVHILPPAEFTTEYLQLRLKINNWYYKKVLQSPSTEIQLRYLAQYIPFKKRVKLKLRRNLHGIQNFFPGNIKKLIRKENEMLLKEASYIFYKQWLSLLNIGGMFTVTPFLHEIEIAGRILSNEKLPVVASIHSFDNVTKRGWPAFFFDHYIVWNKYNKAELKRINPDIKDENISVAGPPQFDFHYDEHLFQSKKEWLKDLGLPENKKIILYSGGSDYLFPNEPQYVKHIEEAFRKGMIAHDAIVLLRPHPLDRTDRWVESIGDSEFIFFKKSPNTTQGADFANVTMESISQFVSTLKYSDIHINLCSTMTVDGSVFDKPQIGPYYDNVNPGKQSLLRKMYFQEHFLPVINSNVLYLAHSKEHLIHLINETLNDPESFNEGCKKCVEEIITFTDGKSAERVAGILKSFFS
jgi:hypothetical protein